MKIQIKERIIEDMETLKINWLESLKDEENVYLYGLSKVNNRIFKELKKENGSSYLKIFRDFNLPPRSAYYWKNGKRPIPLKKFLSLIEDSSLKFNMSKIMSNIKVGFGSGSRKKICSLPYLLEPKLSYFIGYVMGDGCLVKKDWTIAICDELESQMDYIADILKELFSLSGKKIKEDGKTIFYIYSKGLWVYLNKVFQFPIGEKKGKLRLPTIIKESSVPIQKEFLRGFMDADGGIARIEEYKKIPQWLKNKPQITISQSSKDFINDIKDMILKLGLPVEGPYYSPINKGYRLTLTGMRKMKICRNFKIFRSPIKERRLKEVCNLARVA